MSEQAAQIAVAAVAVYLLVGVLFALLFVVRGATVVDPQARGASRGFRLIILPGVAALWPLLAARWLAGGGPPEERNAHRDRARRRAP